MKKLRILLVPIMLLSVVVLRAELKSRALWNAEVPNDAVSIDSDFYFNVANSLIVSGTMTISEDLQITLDAEDEKFNVTHSSGMAADGAVVTIYISTGTVVNAQYGLRIRYNANAETNGDMVVFEDNNGDDVFTVASDGEIMIDATPGTGSGTTISSILLTPNDAEFRLDSETNDITIGDGTNDTVFSDDGKITQTGDATLTLQDGSDLIITSNANDSPFISATSNDIMSAELTVNVVIVTTITISGDDIIDFAGAAISVVSNVLGITADGVGDTQLEYDTGQALTSTSDPTFGKLFLTTVTISGDDIIDFAGNDLTVTSNVLNVDDSFIQNDVDDDNSTFRLTMGSATVTNELIVSGTLDLPSGSVQGADLVSNSVTSTQLADDITVDTITVNTDLILGTNKFSVTANGQTVYTVTIATALAVTNEYEVTEMDGKAGWFEIYMGTHNVSGVFASDATVTLSASSTAKSSTSDDNSDTLNVFDAGTTIKIENQTYSEQFISGFVSYRD